MSATEASRDAENNVKQAKMDAISAHMTLQNALSGGGAVAIRQARKAYGEAAAAAGGAMADMAVNNGQVALAAATEGGDSSVIANAEAALAAAKAMSKAASARNAANALLAGKHHSAAEAAQDSATMAAAAAYAAAMGEKTAADYRGAVMRRGGDPNKMKAAEERAQAAQLKKVAEEKAKEEMQEKLAAMKAARKAAREALPKR